MTSRVGGWQGGGGFFSFLYFFFFFFFFFSVTSLLCVSVYVLIDGFHRHIMLFSKS